MQERELKLSSGWMMLPLHIVALAAVVTGFIFAVSDGFQTAPKGTHLWLLAVVTPAFILWLLTMFGYVVNGPNQCQVVQLFGDYMGTVRDTGFWWGNPFYTRTVVSLRARTFETGMMGTEQVNDPATG